MNSSSHRFNNLPQAAVISLFTEHAYTQVVLVDRVYSDVQMRVRVTPHTPPTTIPLSSASRVFAGPKQTARAKNFQ